MYKKNIIIIIALIMSSSAIAEIKMITSTPIASLRLGQVPYIPGKEPEKAMSELILGQWFDTMWTLLRPDWRDPYQQCVLTYGEALTCTQSDGDWFYVESHEQNGFDMNSMAVGPMCGWIQSKYVIPVDDFQEHSLVVTVPWAMVKYNNGHNLLRVPMGTEFALYQENETTYTILLADDVHGEIEKSDVCFFGESMQASLEEIRTAIINHAKSLVGSNYCWGGQCVLNQHMSGSPMGFDGSGLAFISYRSCGMRIARTALSIFLETERINGSDLQPGDFIFFAYQDQPSHIYDVLMYAGGHTLIESNPVQGVIANGDIARLGKFIKEIQSGEPLTISFYGRLFPIVIYFGTYMQTLDDAEALRFAAQANRNV